MEREVDIPELIDLLKLAEQSFTGDLLEGVSLYNPSIDEEYRPFSVEKGVAQFTDLKGRSRSVPFSAMGLWSAVIPANSILNSPELLSHTKAGKRQELVSEINLLHLPSGHTQSYEDCPSSNDLEHPR